MPGGANGKDTPIRHQNRRTNFNRGRLHQIHRRSAGIIPHPCRGHVLFCVGVIVAFHREDRLVGKQRPGLFAAGVVFGAGCRPGICQRVVDGCLSGEDGAKQQRAIWQDAAGRVTNVRPAWRGRNAGPGIEDRIIDFSSIEIAPAIAVFATRHKDAAIIQHCRGVVEPRVLHRGEWRPGAVDIVAKGVWLQPIPVLSAIFLAKHGPVGEQEHRADASWRRRCQGLPCTCHESLLQSHEVVNTHLECLRYKPLPSDHKPGSCRTEEHRFLQERALAVFWGKTTGETP